MWGGGFSILFGVLTLRGIYAFGNLDPKNPEVLSYSAVDAVDCAAGPHEGWFAGRHGESCTAACARHQLICEDSANFKHKGDVDSSQELTALVKKNNGVLAPGEGCVKSNNADVPNWAENGVCHIGDADRTQVTFNCAAETSPNNHRLCYCSNFEKDYPKINFFGKGFPQTDLDNGFASGCSGVSMSSCLDKCARLCAEQVGCMFFSLYNANVNVKPFCNWHTTGRLCKTGMPIYRITYTVKNCAKATMQFPVFKSANILYQFRSNKLCFGKIEDFKNGDDFLPGATMATKWDSTNGGYHECGKTFEECKLLCEDTHNCMGISVGGDSNCCFVYESGCTERSISQASLYTTYDRIDASDSSLVTPVCNRLCAEDPTCTYVKVETLDTFARPQTDKSTKKA